MPDFSDRIKPINSDALRDMVKLMRDPRIIPFTAANPAAETIDLDFLKALIDKAVYTQGLEIFQYGMSNGHMPLRESIVEYWLKPMGLNVGIENILPMTGAKQGLDLPAKIFLNKGDIMLAETATFTGAINTFKTYQVDIQPVEMDDCGIILDNLEAQILKYHPKMLYTIPTYHNPTGRTLPIVRRKAIVEMAEKYDFIVLEDDPYFELRYNGERVPPIKSFDKYGNVILLNTFSKILSPGIRVGFSVASEEITKKLVVAKQGADATSPTLTQAIADEFLRSEHMEEHLEKVRKVHGARRNAMLAAIREFFPKDVRFSVPDGGLFIWVELPGHPNVLDIQLKSIAEDKVAFMPGHIFHLDPQTGSNTMRLNFSSCKPEDIPIGIERLGKRLKSIL